MWRESVLNIAYFIFFVMFMFFIITFFNIVTMSIVIFLQFACNLLGNSFFSLPKCKVVFVR